jgi:hypothetical protein
MSRVRFEKGKQRNFLLNARKRIGGRSADLADVCRVHRRTLSGWIREKYLMKEEALIKIERELKLKRPEVKILPDYWSTSKAGKATGKRNYIKYGNPATLEDRRKGGRVSCRVQQEVARKGVPSGFVVRKKVNIPENSNELAEAVGIILGDGHISRFQVLIHTSALVDGEYSCYMRKLFENLFRVDVKRRKISKNTITLVLSSREIVEFFNNMGLKTGSKIRNGAEIPEWNRQDEDFMRMCLRGLFDTDGCVYNHKHYTRGREYNDIGWAFRNKTVKLLEEFQDFLLRKGYNSKLIKYGVAIYNRRDIHRYFKEVGSSNPKHIKKYADYFRKLGEVTERP